MERNQQGSVSPVLAMLLMVVLLLLGAFLDREWLNFKLFLAQEIADFAAESGARTAQVWDTIRITRRQIEYVPSSICLDLPACTKRQTILQTVTHWSYPVLTAEEQQLLREWRSQAGCSADPEAPNWSCEGVEVLRREIRYPSQTDYVMRTVFSSNWKDQQLARLVTLDTHVNANERLVRVEATVEIRSVTGLMGWQRSTRIVGSAITRIDPIQFQVR